MRVTISTNKYSILLRWSYLKKRYSLSIGEISEKNLVFAEKIKTSIEIDISRKLFDFNEYLLLASNNKIKKDPKPLPVIPTTSFLFMYQQYVELTGNMNKKRNKLYVTLQMLNKFGDVPIDNIPVDITHYSLPLISEDSLPVFQSKVYHFGRCLI